MENLMHYPKADTPDWKEERAESNSWSNLMKMLIILVSKAYLSFACDHYKLNSGPIKDFDSPQNTITKSGTIIVTKLKKFRNREKWLHLSLKCI